MKYSDKQHMLELVEATLGKRISKLTGRVDELREHLDSVINTTRLAEDIRRTFGRKVSGPGPTFSDQELELAKLKSRIDGMEENVALIFRRQISGVDDSGLREMVDDLARTVFNLCEERRFYYTPEERAYLCDKENRKKRAEKVSPLDIAEIKEHLHEVEDSITNLSKEVRHLGDLLKRLT